MECNFIFLFSLSFFLSNIADICIFKLSVWYTQQASLSDACIHLTVFEVVYRGKDIKRSYLMPVNVSMS